MSETNAIHCDRCGREELPEGPGLLPPGWEGAAQAHPPYGAVEAVCPGCQYAEWHPHCLSLVDAVTGKRVDPEVEWAGMPPAERDYSRVVRCDLIDTTVAWLDGDPVPEGWRCPACGGSAFDGVHRDYPTSGFIGARFSAEGEVDEP